MLHSLITELSFEFSILIEDSIERSGSCLINSIISNTSNKNVLLVDMEPHSFSSYPNTVQISILHFFGQYDSLLEKILKMASGSETLVVFPSLSLFLMNYGVSKFGQLLRCLKDNKDISSVAAVIHTDVFSSSDTLPLTEYMFNTIVKVSAIDVAELSTAYYGHAECVRCQASGKTDSSEEYFTLANDLTIDLVHASSSAAIKALAIDETKVDITADLTFKLSLNEQEREARSKLQLPYLKRDDEKVEMLSKANNSGAPRLKIGSSTSAVGEGKIYYQYDDADDFDEEDPDDDLDI
ncbi:elongator complex protein 5-like [Watersipora subatra]|uniref:elongator complex protein 5-like n=1 Tax=Watersipora subatra TaxID=2589382 RepID=UPI00355C43C3